MKKITIIILILLIFGVFWELNKKENIIVTNFEECVALGNPVMESYPRQCRHNDKTYIEEIKKQNSNNEIMGYIRKIEDKKGVKYFDIDVVEWLSSTDGTCIDEGNLATSDIPVCNPNGFLIVNDDKTEKRFMVLPELHTVTKVSEFNISEDGIVDIDLESFASSSWDVEYFKITPYRFVLEDGVIVKITEQYIP